MRKYLGWPGTTRTLLLILWIMRFSSQLYTASGGTAENLSVVDSGNVANQLQILALFLIGLYYSKSAIQRLKKAKGFWLTALLLYCAWSCCTILWTDDMSLTLRRLAQFFTLMIAWAGIGAGFYGGEGGPALFLKDFRRACIVLIIMCVPIIGPELTPTNLLNPAFDSVLRQKHPDAMGAASFGLLACIAPVFVSGRVRIRLASKWSAAAILGFLLFYRSRSPLVSSGILFCYLACSTVQTKTVRVGLKAAIILSVVLGLIVVGSPNAFYGTAIGDWIARGNDTKTMSEFNGRTPLWEYIWYCITEAPWTGHGWGAFWTSTRMEIVWSRLYWRAPLAHNGFLDEWVQTGLIGLSLIMSFFGATFIKLKGLSRMYPQSNSAMLWIVLFMLLNTVESYLQNWNSMPCFAVMLMCFSCLSVKTKTRAAARTSSALYQPDRAA